MDQHTRSQASHMASCLDPAVLAAFPHTLALNDPPGGYPVVISSFGTSSGFVLPSGSGTVVNDASITGGNLVLTPNAGSQAGIGLYGQPVAVGAGVQVEFTYTSSGGSGADGIAFFVLDASQVSSASAVVPGGYGGGLGYSDDGRAGITGGVLGIGFDTYGNYSAVDQGPQTGTGRSPNSVDIRGAGNAATSGYALLNTTAFAPGIDGTRTAKVTLVSRWHEHARVGGRQHGRRQDLHDRHQRPVRRAGAAVLGLLRLLRQHRRLDRPARNQRDGGAAPDRPGDRRGELDAT